MGRVAQMVITGLPFDLLKLIMLIVVQSSNGADYFANAISVCKMFLNISEDKDILKAVVFDNVRLSGRYGLFQQINGLVSRCAHAGNVTAQYLLAKIIMYTSSQLLNSRHQYLVDEGSGENNSLASSFMAYFTRGRLRHYELVKLFLCQSSPSEVIKMVHPLIHYIVYIVGPNRSRNLELIFILYRMESYARLIRSFGVLETKNIVTLEEIRTRLAALGEWDNRLDNDRFFKFQVLKYRVYSTMTKLLLGEIDDTHFQFLYREYDIYINELKKMCVRSEGMGRAAPSEISWYIETVDEVRATNMKLVHSFEVVRGRAILVFDQLFNH